MKRKIQRRQIPRETAAKFRSFTKTLILMITITALIDVQLSYVLAFLDKDPVITLSERIVEVLLGVILGYLAKAYFETKQEKKQELDEYKAVMRYEGADGETEEDGHG